MYKDTTKEIADYYKVSESTVKEWFKKGYPVYNETGSVTRVKLEGAEKVGRNLRFNLEIIKSFIENLGNEKWQFLEENTRLRMARLKSRQIGRMNSRSAEKDFKALLMERISEQKETQKKRKHAFGM